MLYCTTCGKQNPDTAKFCTGCGNRFPVEEQVIELYCGQCGKANKETAKFCVFCGSGMIKLTTADVTVEKEIPNTEPPETVFFPKKEQYDFPQSDQTPVLKIEELKEQLDNPTFTEVESNKHDQINESVDSTEFAAFEIDEEKDSSLTQPQSSTTFSIAKEYFKSNELTVESENEIKITTDIHEVGAVTENNSKHQKEDHVNYAATHEDYMQEYDEIFNGNEKKRFKKRLAWGPEIIVILALGIGGYFFFNSLTKKSKTLITNTKEAETLPASDTIDSKDSAILVVNETPTTPTLVVAEEPALPDAPSRQQVLTDLASVSLCNNAITASGATVLSFNVISKNSRQYSAVITFSQAGSDTRYIVSVLYENRDKMFVYKTSNCIVKAVPEEKPPAIVPVVLPEAKHDVRADLIAYLSNKKIFAGIGYDDVSEVSVTRIGAPVKYDDTGNTSYTVELVINTRSCKCQAIYTATGKFYVNPLK